MWIRRKHESGCSIARVVVSSSSKDTSHPDEDVTTEGSDTRTQHRLAGAIEKFNRSKEHFDLLGSEMDAFFNSEPRPYGSLGEFDANAGEWVERFQVIEPPPLRLGAIFGDCVHNLRSSLDHLMWQVTLLDGGVPDRNTQFPVARRARAQFEEMADRRIPGLSPKHRAMVEQVQPYHASTERGTHFLALLTDLDNVDKHQIVTPTFNCMGTDANEILDGLAGQYHGEGPPPVHSFWVVRRGSLLQHGTPWLRIVWRKDAPPPRTVTLSGNVDLGIAFGEFGLDASDFKKVASAALRIIQAFMADFPETEFSDEPQRHERGADRSTGTRPLPSTWEVQP